MSNLWSTVLAIPLFVGIVLLLSTLAAVAYSIPLVFLWNYAIVNMFGLGEVTILQMAAFLILILILRYWIHLGHLSTENIDMSNPTTKIDWNAFIEKMNSKKLEA